MKSWHLLAAGAIRHQYINDARVPGGEETAKLIAAHEPPVGDRELILARIALTACRSAMLGKVNPKSPAWGLLYAAQDAQRPQGAEEGSK